MKKHRRHLSLKLLLLVIVLCLQLTIIESLLIFFDVGNSSAILIQDEEDDKFVFNKHYMDRYFFNTPEYSIPAPNTHVFEIEKPDSVFRIYVIGESTSQGFPFSKTEAFPFQLGQMLNSAGTNLTFEVINFSMSGINSITGLEIVEEVIDYPPDLAILYFGHNEFVGIGGAGQFNNPTFRLSSFLSQFRIVQVLKGFLSGIVKQDQRTQIEIASSQKLIAIDEPIFSSTLSHFRENYESMLDIFRMNEIPTISCGVVANIKDFPPLVSSQIQDSSLTFKLLSLIEMDSNNLKNDLEKIVKGNSQACYIAGKELLKNQKLNLAKYFLHMANDLDQLRFRAPSGINNIIEEISDKNGCYYLDFQNKFDQLNEDSICGNTELLEHVHPTVEGHSIMAGEIADTILHRILNVKVDESYKNIEILSSLVENIVTVRFLKKLYSTHPLTLTEYFNPIGFQFLFEEYSKNQSSIILREDISDGDYYFANDLFDEGYNRALVHKKFACKLLNENRLDDAFNEFKIAHNQQPFDVVAANNLAVMSFYSGDIQFSYDLLHEIFDRGGEYITAYQNLWFVLNKMNYNEEILQVENVLKDLDEEFEINKMIMDCE